VTGDGAGGDGPPVPSGRPWPLRRRLAALVACAAGIGAMLALVLARPGGPVLSDTPEHIKLIGTIGPLSSQPVRQHFVATADGLSGISTRFGTSGGVKRCSVRATLRDGSTVVATSVHRCGSLPDTRPFSVLRFDPQPASRGRAYDLELSLAEAGGDSVFVWAGEDLDHRLPPATSPTDTLPATLELHTFYGGGHHAWDQVSLALRRIGEYRPWFQQPAAIVCWGALALGALLALVAVRGRAALVLLVVLACAKGLVWAAVVPPLEAPDEPAHFAYAQFMAESHRIPKRNAFQLGLPPSQSYSPRLRAAITALHQEILPPGDRPDFPPHGDPGPVAAIDAASPAANGAGPAAGYAPVYYLPAALLYAASGGPFVHTVELMRLWSIVLGAVAGWLTLLAGRRVFRGHEAAAMALAVAVVLQPELSQQTAAINNDALAIAAGAGALLAAYALTAPAPARSRWVCFGGGLALGLAMFKSFGAVLAPVLLAAWVIGRVRTARGNRPSVWREAAQAAAGIASTIGAWTVYAAAFGFPSASLADIQPVEGPKDLRTYLHLLDVDWFQLIRQHWIDQLWGNFSWVDTPFPDWVHAILLAVTLATVGLAVTWAVVVAARWWHGRHRGYGAEALSGGPGTDDAAIAAISMLAIVTMFGFFVVVGYLSFHRTGLNNLIQGRYAVMLLPAILSLPSSLIRYLWPRVSPLVPMLCAAAAMVALDIGGVALVVERFYL